MNYYPVVDNPAVDCFTLPSFDIYAIILGRDFFFDLSPQVYATAPKQNLEKLLSNTLSCSFVASAEKNNLVVLLFNVCYGFLLFS